MHVHHGTANGRQMPKRFVFAQRSGTKLEGILIEEVSEAWIAAVPNGVVEGAPTTIKVVTQDEAVQVQYLRLQIACL